MYQIKQPKLVLTALVFGLVALQGCGGGASSSSESNNSANNTTKPETKPSTPNDLENTTYQPKPIENINPLDIVVISTAESEKSFVEAVKTGLYVQSTFNVIGIGANECAVASGTACQGFIRYYLNRNNELVSDSWAYLSKQNKWIKSDTSGTLLRSTIPLNVALVDDFYHDGKQWSKGSLDTYQRNAVIKYQQDKDHHTFLQNNIRYRLKAAEYDLSILNILPDNKVYYATDAKLYDFGVMLTDQPVYSLVKSDKSYSPNNFYDTAKYSTLSDFITAHSSFSKPFCFVTGLNRLIKFNADGTLAINKQTGCDADLAQFEKDHLIQKYGITTVNDSKVIVLEADLRDIAKLEESSLPINTSQFQTLPIIVKHSDGYIYAGTRYEPNFINKTYENFLNESAFLDYLSYLTGVSKVQIKLPNKD
ncbi:hypothetical protein [Acinetobacter puyangensis]|uniref:hypothetical protein n=1 Tax=Acinetobacter puyangensis TaxID=1096779 RepID=UPI003A4D7745